MITGDKVFIRTLEKDDIPLVYQWSNDYELRGLFNFKINLSGREEIIRELDECSRKDFIIVEKNTKKAVGRCMLTDIDLINKKSQCMVYIGGEDARDMGYDTEAVELLEKYAFESLNLNRIGTYVFDFNKGAMRSYKKCGFKVEGIMRESLYRDGHYHDVYFMGITRSEYEEKVNGGDETCSEENM